MNENARQKLLDALNTPPSDLAAFTVPVQTKSTDSGMMEINEDKNRDLLGELKRTTTTTTTSTSTSTSTTTTTTKKPTTIPTTTTTTKPTTTPTTTTTTKPTTTTTTTKKPTRTTTIRTTTTTTTIRTTTRTSTRPVYPTLCSRNDASIQKRYQCENSTLKLCCLSNTILRIKSANYGRTSEKICTPFRRNRMFYPDPSRNPYLNCRSRNSFDIVKANCDGKPNCEIRAHNDVFGNPCLNIEKFLEVEYECVPKRETTIATLTTTRPTNAIFTTSFRTTTLSDFFLLNSCKCK
jgi:hypothetical protein